MELAAVTVGPRCQVGVISSAVSCRICLMQPGRLFPAQAGFRSRPPGASASSEYRSAAVPATTGVADDVPRNLLVFPPGLLLLTGEGAARSITPCAGELFRLPKLDAGSAANSHGSLLVLLRCQVARLSR